MAEVKWQRTAWHARLKPGAIDDYRQRHDQIWPEMAELLKAAGIRNYSIWRSGLDLFGYYESADLAQTAAIQAASPVVQRWNAYMADILIMDFDPESGVTPPLQEMFYLP